MGMDGWIGNGWIKGWISMNGWAMIEELGWKGKDKLQYQWMGIDGWARMDRKRWMGMDG